MVGDLRTREGPRGRSVVGVGRRGEAAGEGMGWTYHGDGGPPANNGGRGWWELAGEVNVPVRARGRCRQGGQQANANKGDGGQVTCWNTSRVLVCK